ncbi:MAG TPA: hypothetical protein VJC37_08090 [Planctomycetota bacterium]|nr:hypothetical protein [Planctomycetota bacterium]
MISKKVDIILAILVFIAASVTSFLFRASLRRYLFMGIESLGLITLIAYSFTICIFIIYFIRVFRLWRDDASDWHMKMKGAYLLFAISSISSGLILGYPFYVAEAKIWNLPDYLLVTLSGFFMFAFPVGIVLLVLGIKGLKYRQEKPASYIKTTLITAVVFILSGTIPSIFIVVWSIIMLEGGPGW